MNIAASFKTKLSQAARFLEKLALPLKKWRAKRKLHEGLVQLQSQHGAATAHVGDKILVLCRWSYGANPAKPTLRVDIFVTFSARQIGAGFVAASQYDARAYQFEGMVQDSYGDPKENWQLALEENFNGPTAQATAKQHIAMGDDPMFERYKVEPDFEKLLKKKFPALAAHYEALVYAKVSVVPTLISGGGARL